MSRLGTALALLAALLGPGPALAYRFAVQPLTDNDRFDGNHAVDGSIVAWESCALVAGPDPDCEIWAFDANQPELGPQQITNNSTEDDCIDVAGRRLIHRRPGTGQVVLQDLDAGESILSSAGVDDACPRLSRDVAVWRRDDQVIVHDLDTGFQQAVASGYDYGVSGPFVVWQQGVGSALEVWFLDTTALPWTPQRLTNNGVRDEFPRVYAGSRFGFPFPSTVLVPFVTWERDVGGVAQVMLWDGTTTTQVTSSPLRGQIQPRVSGISATLLRSDEPTLVWISAAPPELTYCTVCDGDPANNLLPPGGGGSGPPDVNGPWIAYQGSALGGPILFFDGVDVTPVTTGPGPDRVPLLGFRSTPPVGPILAWERFDGSDLEIYFAPEPATGAAGLTAAAALVGLRRRALRGAAQQAIPARGGP